MNRVGVRWTLGNVSREGFEALRLSILGAAAIFGPRAEYAVFVNSVDVEEAALRVGNVPVEVQWRDATGLIPPWLKERFDPTLGGGTGWKFAPLRAFPDRYELALDNDCILFRIPEAVARWLASGSSFVIAEDVRRCLGVFSPWCGPGPRNSGIRGLPPDFDLEAAIRRAIALVEGPLSSELDEQGLQVAALEASGTVHVVRTHEVSICSPFWPHQPWVGRCGAHFVGLNARDLPWRYEGRPASELVREHFRARRLELLEHLGGALPPMAAGAPSSSPAELG